MWKLKKPLPGRRAAGARWTDHVRDVHRDLGYERFAAIPTFFRKRECSVLVEAHMDDFHGCGRRSDVDKYLSSISEK